MGANLALGAPFRAVPNILPVIMDCSHFTMCSTDHAKQPMCSRHAWEPFNSFQPPAPLCSRHHAAVGRGPECGANESHILPSVREHNLQQFKNIILQQHEQCPTQNEHCNRDDRVDMMSLPLGCHPFCRDQAPFAGIPNILAVIVGCSCFTVCSIIIPSYPCVPCMHGKLPSSLQAHVLLCSSRHVPVRRGRGCGVNESHILLYVHEHNLQQLDNIIPQYHEQSPTQNERCIRDDRVNMTSLPLGCQPFCRDQAPFAGVSSIVAVVVGCNCFTVCSIMIPSNPCIPRMNGKLSSSFQIPALLCSSCHVPVRRGRGCGVSESQILLCMRKHNLQQLDNIIPQHQNKAPPKLSFATGTILSIRT
jgi:hypothetical protein